jgi:hypothetical protein
MDSICSPEMPRRVFMASIAGGLLAAPLAAGRSGALARQTRWRYESWRDGSSIRSRRAGRGASGRPRSVLSGTRWPHDWTRLVETPPSCLTRRVMPDPRFYRF